MSVNKSDLVVLDTIIKCVCDMYNISSDELKHRSRERYLVVARQAISYIALNMTSLNQEYIGQILGGRHRTSVLNAQNVVKDRMSVDAGYRREINKIENEIKYHFMPINNTLTKEETQAIINKAVEDASTILINAMSYVGIKHSLGGSVIGPDGRDYEIRIRAVLTSKEPAIQFAE